MHSLLLYIVVFWPHAVHLMMVYILQVCISLASLCSLTLSYFSYGLVAHLIDGNEDCYAKLTCSCGLTLSVFLLFWTALSASCHHDWRLLYLLSWWLWCQARLLHLLIVRMAAVQGSVFTNLKWKILAFNSLIVVWCVAPGICSTEVKLFTIPIAVQDVTKQLNSISVAICCVVRMNNNNMNNHSCYFVRRCSQKLANRDTSRPRISIFSIRSLELPIRVVTDHQGIEIRFSLRAHLVYRDEKTASLL